MARLSVEHNGALRLFRALKKSRQRQRLQWQHHVTPLTVIRSPGSRKSAGWTGTNSRSAIDSFLNRREAAAEPCLRVEDRGLSSGSRNEPFGRVALRYSWVPSEPDRCTLLLVPESHRSDRGFNIKHEALDVHIRRTSGWRLICFWILYYDPCAVTTPIYILSTHVDSPCYPQAKVHICVSIISPLSSGFPYHATPSRFSVSPLLAIVGFLSPCASHAFPRAVSLPMPHTKP